MSRFKPPVGPQAALDALLANAAGDPIRRAVWLDALDVRLRPLLPPSLAAHARLANVDGAKLVFVVDSPVWHARLRLAASDLLDAARSIGLEVSDLVVKTTMQPMQPQQAGSTASVAPLVPASAREALQAALASLHDPVDGSSGDGSSK
ncbi:MAG: DUF721 domain-containing protein [Luteimonas sp.]